MTAITYNRGILFLTRTTMIPGFEKTSRKASNVLANYDLMHAIINEIPTEGQADLLNINVVCKRWCAITTERLFAEITVSNKLLKSTEDVFWKSERNLKSWVK